MAQKGHSMALNVSFRRPTHFAALALSGALALTALGASPARADLCDDVGKQLASQIDGLKVNFRAANIVYLTHPAAKELSLGCRGDNYSIEFYAKGDRKCHKRTSLL